MYLTLGFIKMWLLDKLRLFQYKGFHPNHGSKSKPGKKKRWRN